MKLKIFILFIASLILSGCTRNNGDIGHWFGSWQVEQITADGLPWQDSGNGQYFWEFQNDIIKVVCVAPTGNVHEIYYCVGTWSQSSDNTLIFNFSHTDDSGIFHKPFWIMNFPTDGPFPLTIVSKNGKHYVLKRVDETTGTVYYYYITKR